MEDIKGELMALFGAVTIFVIGYIKDRIRVKLQDQLELRVKVDNAVIDAEATGQSGPVKKLLAVNIVKEQLKNEGVGIAKRLGVSLLGGLKTSIERSVTNNINNKK